MNKCISCSLSIRRCCGLVNPKFRSHTSFHLPPKTTGKATIHSIPLCKRVFECGRPLVQHSSHSHTHTQWGKQMLSAVCPVWSVPLFIKTGTWEAPDLPSPERNSGHDVRDIPASHALAFTAQTHEKMQLERETVTLSNTFCPIETPEVLPGCLWSLKQNNNNKKLTN